MNNKIKSKLIGVIFEEDTPEIIAWAKRNKYEHRGNDGEISVYKKIRTEELSKPLQEEESN